MSDLQLIQLDNSRRLEILRKIGFDLDEQGYVIETKTKKRVECSYSNEEVHINTAAILPGSIKVVNATPLTMSQYFTEHCKNEQ